MICWDHVGDGTRSRNGAARADNRPLRGQNAGRPALLTANSSSQEEHRSFGKDPFPHRAACGFPAGLSSHTVWRSTSLCVCVCVRACACACYFFCELPYTVEWFTYFLEHTHTDAPLTFLRVKVSRRVLCVLKYLCRPHQTEPSQGFSVFDTVDYYTLLKTHIFLSCIFLGNCSGTEVIIWRVTSVDKQLFW